MIAGLPLTFAAPALLWALALIPALWLLLRLLPPAPVVRRFPAVALLLGLTERDADVHRTPLLLMLLRTAALMAAILGFAGPVLGPQGAMHGGSGPVLMVVEADWPDAARWPALQARLTDEASAAVAAGRPVAVAVLSEAQAPRPVFGLPGAARDRIAALRPAPWAVPAARFAALAGALPEGRFETIWQADAIDRPERAALLAALQARGTVRVLTPPAPPPALTAPQPGGAGLSLALLRPARGPAETYTLAIAGTDPNGVERLLARQPVAVPAGADRAAVTLNLAPELRNRVQRITLEGGATAGALALADDGARRPKVALVDPTPPQEGLELLSPSHYLRAALADGADLIEGALPDMVRAAPQGIVLADAGRLPADQADALIDWVRKGGVLVRFAGPRLAASIEPDAPDDLLLPVRLRPGDRALGGTMTWGAPRPLAPFAKDSLFSGLTLPPDVTVGTQVLAEPGPELSDHTLATLQDGTPLVTQSTLGEGRVVLFHVTATADWSSLPASGLFVQMLERLAMIAPPARDRAAVLTGGVWRAVATVDATGALQPVAEGAAGAGIPGVRLAAGPAGPEMPAGLYQSGGRRMALPLLPPGAALAPAAWPAGVTLDRLDAVPARSLKGLLLAAALALLAVEALAAIWLSGRFARGLAAVLALGLLALPDPRGARALDDPALLRAAGGTVLAHVLTGDAAVDRLADEGLTGLAWTLTLRTAVEPGPPVGIDLEKDDLSLYAFLYWPIAADEPLPSTAAYGRLNAFLRSGGLILFDTRDGDGSAAPGTSPEAERLKVLAAGLDIPALAPVPPDHVLTRSFYLLDDFPGRYVGAPVWAEAPPPDAVAAAGVPFRSLNDGVSPVVIGGNDWASAWAMDDRGQPLYPVGEGVAGERQREMAARFGVNLVMYVLTGNYKSDQVHVPALLERLGQ